MSPKSTNVTPLKSADGSFLAELADGESEPSCDLRVASLIKTRFYDRASSV